MSSAGEFSATTLTGVDQADVRDARCDTQMSLAPAPPARSDPNQSVSPSVEIAELVSNEAPFTAVTAAGVPNGAAGRRARGEPDVAVAAHPIGGEVDLQQIAGQRRIVGA